MKLHQLRAFVAVANAGGIRGAARALGSSPAAITKSLRQLEESTQAPLLVRTASGVTLTEFGQTMLVHARLMVGQLVRAQEAIDAMRGAAGGKVAMAVAPWVAMTFLPPAIVRFGREMPEVRLEIYEGLLPIAVPRLREGSLDFLIGRPTRGAAGVEFQYRPLFSSSCAIVARQGHPRANTRSLAALVDQTWALSWNPAADGPGVEELFTQHEVPVPRRIHEINSYAVGIPLLRHSDMLTVLPWPLVELVAAKEGLCALPVREQLGEALIGVISRGGNPLSAAAECFIECLIETIRTAVASASAPLRKVLKSVDILV